MKNESTTRIQRKLIWDQNETENKMNRQMEQEDSSE